MKVLFICTHNSARSQMAEALVNKLSTEWVAESAGTEPAGLNPYAVKAMEEIGISMEGQRSKSIEEFRGREFDLVVTVCDHANKTCPFFPGKRHIHHSFEDPSSLSGSEEEIMEGVRRIREEIRKWVSENFL